MLVSKGGLHVIVGRHARCRLLIDIAIGHDHNHRFGIACGNEVVKNLGSAALLEPYRLITTRTMQEIKNRVLLPAHLISRRQINHHAALHAQCGRIIPHRAHLAMRHIMHRHRAIGLRVKNKGIHHVLDIAQHMCIVVIEHLHAINNKVVHIKIRLQVVESQPPLVALPLHQRIHARINDEAHGVGSWSRDTKRY